MWSLLAAALLAVQPAPADLGQDGDFQCLAVVAVVLGTTPKESLEDLRNVTGLTAIFMYYLGRIDERYPGLDLMTAFKRLDDDEQFKRQFGETAARCSAEAEARGQKLQDMGRVLQDLPLPLPGLAG